MRISRELEERIIADRAKGKEQSKEQNPPDLLRAKIEQLLEQGVSRQWIAHYLDCPIRTVNAVTKPWKRDKLPKILQERAKRACSA